MGAFMIFRITFKKRKDMLDFTKKYRTLVYDDTDTAFVAWKYLWEPNTIICYMGFMGYRDPELYKKKLKGKIKRFDWIPINDLNSRWEKDRDQNTEN